MAPSSACSAMTRTRTNTQKLPKSRKLVALAVVAAAGAAVSAVVEIKKRKPFLTGKFGGRAWLTDLLEGLDVQQPFIDNKRFESHELKAKLPMIFESRLRKVHILSMEKKPLANFASSVYQERMIFGNVTARRAHISRHHYAAYVELCKKANIEPKAKQTTKKLSNTDSQLNITAFTEKRPDVAPFTKEGLVEYVIEFVLDADI
ncbi:hypothetical protein K435DRAFT_812206, partial [Dendrothele bispora CBS 962.96]